ncbi:carbohydrate-binding protein [Micromonospora sp. NPDC005710]|uniref:carbohydrate-binding protein n=1 Tax=Micromonospora sp. NPDC005710 TaxID=3157051 RepID=UPI0034083FE8
MGGGGQPALTTHTQAVLQPRVRQAEHFGDSSGVQIVAGAAGHGGAAVGYIDNNDWISFRPYNLTGVRSFSARVGAPAGGDGGVDDLTGLSGSGRYIRLLGTTRGTGYDHSLWELEAYSSRTPRLATRRPQRTRSAQTDPGPVCREPSGGINETLCKGSAQPATVRRRFRRPTPWHGSVRR